jgi:glycosyltransferase 2 family protein
MNLPGWLAHRRTSKQWPTVMLWLGYLITAASLVYLFRAVRLNAGALPAHWAERYGSVWFALSVLLFVASVTCGFLIWRRLLSYEPIDIGVIPSANVYLVSQIGKYIPGNIAQHFGRVVMAGRHGIRVATTTKFIVIEMIVVVAAAVSLVAAICLFQPTLRAQMLAIVAGERSPTSMLAIFTLVLVVVLGGVASLTKAASLIREGGTLATLSVARVLQLGLLGLLAFVALGASFHVLLAKCLVVADPGLLACIVWITSSWLISFFTPGAPAGLGVREFVLVTFVAAEFGQPVALESALAFRGVSVIGDLVILGLGLLAGLTARPAANGVRSETQSEKTP